MFCVPCVGFCDIYTDRWTDRPTDLIYHQAEGVTELTQKGFIDWCRNGSGYERKHLYDDKKLNEAVQVMPPPLPFPLAPSDTVSVERSLPLCFARRRGWVFGDTTTRAARFLFRRSLVPLWAHVWIGSVLSVM